MEHSDKTEQNSQDFTHIREVLAEYLEEGGFGPDAYAGPLSVALTGFHNLDTLLGGLHRSNLIILAARPSLGKSSLALNIARNAALEQGGRVVVFSLETGEQEVMQRLLASEAEVNTQQFRQGEFTTDENARVIEARRKLAQADIYIDDSIFLTSLELRSKAKRLHQEKPIDLIIVDYIGMLLQGGDNGDNNVSEMSDISRSLKRLARELNVPVLALSGLSRAPECRPDHSPMLSDLQGSGSIEQDADVVMFIYKADRYYTEQQWQEQYPNEMYPKGIADIIVAKHRNGPTGTVPLRFVDHLARFEPLPERVLERGGAAP